MTFTCPKCTAELSVSLKETLKPYSMTFKVFPDEGKMVSANALADMLGALVAALVAAGETLGQNTFVHVLDASVDEAMAVSITIAANDIAKPESGSAA